MVARVVWGVGWAVGTVVGVTVAKLVGLLAAAVVATTVEVEVAERREAVPVAEVNTPTAARVAREAVETAAGSQAAWAVERSEDTEAEAATVGLEMEVAVAVARADGSRLKW